MIVLCYDDERGGVVTGQEMCSTHAHCLITIYESNLPAVDPFPYSSRGRGRGRGAIPSEIFGIEI
jgi:hypothetical protein